MDASKSEDKTQSAAGDSSSLNLARQFLANSQGVQQTPTMLPLHPQQGAFGLGGPGGLACLPPQVGQFFNGFVPGAQAMVGNPAFYFQGSLPTGNTLVGQNAPGAAGMTLPAAAIAALGSRGLPQFFAAPQRNPPNPQEVQDALAKIAAASGSASLNAGAGAQQSADQQTSASTKTANGGQAPVLVFMECDEESLSDYQCLLRKQIELFEATSDDVQWNAQGRNKAIVLGQVGIRCRYCARLPTWSRARGAVYYSATLDGLYQAAQNMAKNHLCRHCRLIPEDSRQKLMGLRDCKRRAAGGKKYWGEGARVLGVEQCSDGLRFKASKTGRKQQLQE